MTLTGYGFHSTLPRSVSPALISTGNPLAPLAPSFQPPSDQYQILNLPEGASLISKLPSLSVTAKYGWSNTRTHAFIQGWMLQETATGFLSALRFEITSCLPGGMILLPPGFFAGLPSQLTLCATGAEFLAISV